MKVIDFNECNSEKSYNGSVQMGMMCIGIMNGAVDACTYDSGGPAICNRVLTGLVSTGNECGKPNYPGIYVDIEFYRDWIETNQMNNYELLEDVATNEFLVFLKSIPIWLLLCMGVILLLITTNSCTIFREERRRRLEQENYGRLMISETET